MCRPKINGKRILELCDIMSPYLKEDDVYDATLLKKILNEKDAQYILEKWDKIWISKEVVERIYNKFKESKYNYTKNEIIEDDEEDYIIYDDYIESLFEGKEEKEDKLLDRKAEKSLLFLMV